MGQILSSPVIEKEHHSGVDARSAFGLCAMQGWRMSMEDAHVVELDVLGCQIAESGDGDLKAVPHWAMYAVLDGHGGAHVARFCGAHLAEIFKSVYEKRRQKGADADALQVVPLMTESLRETFFKADEELLEDPQWQNDHSGCTATSVLISRDDKMLVCANGGGQQDRAGHMVTAGETTAFDHKPSLESERARIVAADGFVEMDRVNGNLALSRAIGDFEFKSNKTLPPEEQIVTCSPDIMQHQLDYDADDFVVLACDGIWDCLSSQECVDLVYYGINKGGMSLNDISSRIVDVCCAPTTEGTGIGCDNVSIVIVALLKDGETDEEWFARIRAKNVKSNVSFERMRREIFKTHKFPADDKDVFAITTKRIDGDNDGDAKAGTRSGTEATGTESKSASNLINLESIRQLLDTSLQINQRSDQSNNGNYFHGSGLAEMLTSLSQAVAGETTPLNEEDEEEDEEADKIQEVKDNTEKNSKSP
ncbi:type 2C protein phosphatase PTC3 KNAG_0B02450 [Huiozyma naganishii CBS 8797]|uniref:protein-serine/threonine phosphatase n=1 Tax=Huiozyma naganishii (strain ATCC MYA-139 / BCRC 22969 / CBS 8797 / KCTC 17520 / NBRC 10181 / NCYC 3082 / Yp74L-3) TaxID=1071383 RepID=J7RUY4_HUIN7|nr:hypothetical protein KNAG_0B02450 [Kazachstania naganishii CBS 8797]CCK68687.1 hypothetical protein KNAG_0B02450 [Kazachstania naganishii CBS 8797]